jgi:phosphatidylethanolamine N-methyltransferase
MTYVSFVLCALRLGHAPTSRFYLKQTLGVLLCIISGWCYVSCYEALGDYGWFYGDFFIDDAKIPQKLIYHGIYRFMDNPDSIVGYAGFYGVALIVESKTVLLLAFFSQVANFLFVVLVERHHMRKIHGERIRASSGISAAFGEIIRDVVDKNPTLRELNEKASHEIEKIKQKILEEADKLDLEMAQKIKHKVQSWKPKKLVEVLRKFRDHRQKSKTS